MVDWIQYFQNIITCVGPRVSDVQTWSYKSERKSADAERHVKSVSEAEAGEASGVFGLRPLTGWPWRYLKMNLRVKFD